LKVASAASALCIEYQGSEKKMENKHASKSTLKHYNLSLEKVAIDTCPALQQFMCVIWQ